MHDYTAKRGVEACFILAPDDAPSWARDRAALWNAAEARETRSNSVTAREWELALPSEISDAARIEITRAFAQQLVERYGAVSYTHLAEFESELIRERTMAGLQAARARGRKGGRKFALTKAQVRMAQAAMANRDTSVSDLCKELGIKPVTLYRYVDPNGNLREYGSRVLKMP